MTEDPNLKNASKIAEAASKIDLSWLAVAIFFISLFGALALSQFARKWDGHLHDRKGCVQLQEIQGKAFKVDTCTGEVTEFEIGENNPSEITESDSPATDSAGK